MQINHQPGHRDGDAHSHKMEGHPVPVEGGAGGKGMAAERGSVNERPGECLMHRRDDETSVLLPAAGGPLGSGAQSGQAPHTELRARGFVRRATSIYYKWQ